MFLVDAIIIPSYIGYLSRTCYNEFCEFVAIVQEVLLVLPLHDSACHMRYMVYHFHDIEHSRFGIDSSGGNQHHVLLRRSRHDDCSRSNRSSHEKIYNVWLHGDDDADHRFLFLFDAHPGLVHRNGTRVAKHRWFYVFSCGDEVDVFRVDYHQYEFYYVLRRKIYSGHRREAACLAWFRRVIYSCSFNEGKRFPKKQ